MALWRSRAQSIRGFGLVAGGSAFVCAGVTGFDDLLAEARRVAARGLCRGSGGPGSAASSTGGGAGSEGNGSVGGEGDSGSGRRELTSHAIGGAGSETSSGDHGARARAAISAA